MARRSCPIPVVALLNLLFGIGFALVARDRVRADGPFAAPAFPLVMLHAAAVVAPIALYFYAVHPAWSWMYMVDPGGISVLAILPLMVGHGVIAVGGYYVGALLIRADHKKAVAYAIVGLTITALVILLVARARLGVSASYGDFRAHRGRGLMEVELGWAVLVSLMASAGSITYIVFELTRDGRRVRSR